MPVTSPMGDIDIPNVDVWSMIFESPREYPDDQVLFIDGDTRRSYTFSQIKEATVTFGQGLKHMFGWQKGDVLGLYTPNSIDTPVLNFGTLWAGGVTSPANPTYTVNELANQLKDSGAKALATQKALLPVALEAARLARIPASRIILLGDERDQSGKHKHFTDVTAKDAWFKPKKVAIDPKKDIGFIVYSSGTTGLPKGVSLTHYNVVANSYQMRKFDYQGIGHEMDGQLAVLPFFHIYGLAVIVNAPFLTGSKCIVLAKFDLEKACSLIQEFKLTFFYVAPPVVLALGKHPIVDKYDLSSLRWINSAAAPLSPDLAVAVWNRLKIAVKQGYGLSETSPAAIMQMPHEWGRFQGSVGRLVPNMQAKIIDEDGKELPRNEAGELLLKGPNVFGGYWKRPDLEKETFSADGWYRTGDICYVCPLGHFYITDRMKELIKYKGFQVPPAELEAKLVGRDDIADVCVVGVQNKEEATEVPRAYIVLAPGIEASPAKAKEISDWLASQVAPPKKLRGGVRFIAEVPKSQSGKILRRVLRDQAKKEDEQPQAKL